MGSDTNSRARSVSALPRISFGIIVFNGEPFTRYCLRALYPFAHEIIVVEGGHEARPRSRPPTGIPQTARSMPSTTSSPRKTSRTR